MHHLLPPPILHLNTFQGDGIVPCEHSKVLCEAYAGWPKVRETACNILHLGRDGSRRWNCVGLLMAIFQYFYIDPTLFCDTVQPSLFQVNKEIFQQCLYLILFCLFIFSFFQSQKHIRLSGMQNDHNSPRPKQTIDELANFLEANLPSSSSSSSSSPSSLSGP